MKNCDEKIQGRNKFVKFLNNLFFQNSKKNNFDLKKNKKF